MQVSRLTTSILCFTVVFTPIVVAGVDVVKALEIALGVAFGIIALDLTKTSAGIEFDNLKTRFEPILESFQRHNKIATQQGENNIPEESANLEDLETKAASFLTLTEGGYIATKAGIDAKFRSMGTQFQAMDLQEMVKTQDDRANKIQKSQEALETKITELAKHASKLPKQSTAHLTKQSEVINTTLKQIDEDKAAGKFTDASTAQAEVDKSLTAYETATNRAEAIYENNAKAYYMLTKAKMAAKKIDEMHTQNGRLLK